MIDYDIGPIILSLKLAFICSLILFIICLPLAYWLAFTHVRVKFLLQAIFNAPLVLPPSVLGFYLLIAFSPEKFLGKFIQENFSLSLVFSFQGLVLASIIFSFPFMLQSLQSGFQELDPSLREAAFTLGKSPFQTMIWVLLPNIRKAALTGIVLSFSHTIGEFGVVLMIGGNIPGKTRLASIAVYDELEALNYRNANYYSLILVIISVLLLSLLYYINNKDTESGNFR